VKIPPDVWRDIQKYQASFPRTHSSLDVPLFVSYRRGDHPAVKAGREVRIDEKAIEALVKELGQAIGIPDNKPLTPHGLRATAITLWLEHDATLEQAQYAARHKDPRMTERYRKRKFNVEQHEYPFAKLSRGYTGVADRASDDECLLLTTPEVAKHIGDDIVL
jgi:integrase